MPGANEIAAHLGEAHDARGIRDRSRIRQALARGLEHRQRFPQAVVFLGTREVHHQPQRRHRWRRRQPLANASDVGRTESQTVHSRVDLDEHFERTRQHRGLEHPHLFPVVNNRGQPALGEFRQFALGEKSFEQQDPARVPLFAQFDRDVGLDQCKAVGVLERGQHALQSVAVRVGLDHGEHLRAGRLFAHARKVGAQRSEIDLGVQRTGHAAVVRLRWSGKHAADMTTKPATTARRRPPPLGVFRKHGIKRRAARRPPL